MKTAIETLAELYTAATNPSAPFWAGVPGGSNQQRQQALLNVYQGIPIELFELINPRHSQPPTYLTLTSELVSPDSRYLDLHVTEPKADANGNVFFHIDLYGVMPKGSNNLQRIVKGVRNEAGSSRYLSGFKTVRNQFCISPKDVEKGAVSDRDYQILQKYVSDYAAKQAEFMAIKATRPDITATKWIYYGDMEKKIRLSVIPANNKFQALFGLEISYYSEGSSVFRPQLNIVPVNLSNFTLLGQGTSGYTPVRVDNETDNPPIGGVEINLPAPAASVPAPPALPAAIAAPAPAVAPAPSEAEAQALLAKLLGNSKIQALMAEESAI